MPFSIDCAPAGARAEGEAMTPEEAVVVLVTAGDADEAARLGRALVEERLAACVNVVGPIRSIYRWQGAVEEASEHLLIVKARAADVAALEARVRALHSYEVPEVLALPVRAGSAAYLAWLADATGRGT
jgi:periplasmic divalent cation tolerance protein